MFEFFKIDKDLEIYKKNDVIIFGASEAGINTKHLLEKHGIKIIAYTDNDVNKIGKSIEGVKVISVNECVERICQQNHIIVQIGSIYEKEIAKQLRDRGINCYIWYTELKVRMVALNAYLCSLRIPDFKQVYEENEWKRRVAESSLRLHSRFAEDIQCTESIRLMLSAPKVGNTTMVTSVRKSGLNLLQPYHSYKFMDDFIANRIHKSPVKLIIGVRDPIKQNLSLLYAWLTGSETLLPKYYDLAEYWNGGGDVEGVFNKCILNSDEKCYLNEKKKKAETDYLVQNFFEQQIEPFFGVDIYQYPFDKERGYSIYHIHDKLDIMIYQLEKMNNLEASIGGFLEIDNFKLVKANDSSEQWYREGYQNVCKNMLMNRQYVEDCYSSKYIKHFYHEEDIKRFKEQWKVRG